MDEHHRVPAPDGAQSLPESATDVAAATGAVITNLVSARGLRSTTLANRAARMRWFASFVQAQGVRDLDGVTPEQVENFMNARRASGAKATLAERHSRRSAVRLLYKEARRMGLASSDPALDIQLPTRHPIHSRPLTDRELELGRIHAVRNPADTRPAVCWALAEATARTSEMPHVRVSDLDVEAGSVYIHGGATTEPRLGTLTTWGATQIHRRLNSVLPEEGPDPILMGSGHWDEADEGRAAATMALVTVLKAAGLSAPDVNPRSIWAWSGAKALAEGASIDAVARSLGVRSLDQTAAIIGFNWLDRG